MRIAIDIDSTLHPYWDQLQAIARRRFGVDLPYDEQVTWGMNRLRPEQVQIIVAESHQPERVLQAVPYPGAVETVRAWKDAGHYVHVTSHRSDGARAATSEWLAAIGLPYDDLHCSFDKVTRCVELGIELLIDDSPENIGAAVEQGIRVATIAHPWNRDVCEEEDVICGADWAELRARLATLLGTAS